MLHFLQPAGTLFIGLALSAYGLIQSLLYRPSSTSFRATVAAMPEVVAVLLFALGLTAIIVGIVLLISGVRGVRKRAREIDRAYGMPRRQARRAEYEDDWDQGHPAYR